MAAEEHSAALEVAKLSVSFGSIRALDGLTLTVPNEGIIGLVGANGAGKTTALDAITGFVTATGTVTVGGHEVSGLPPHARAQQGVRRTWQSGQLFDDLSARENLLVGAAPLGMRQVLGSFSRRHRERLMSEAVVPILRLVAPELEAQLDRPAGDLPHGQRKLLGLARAVASRPSILLADEPAAGLATAESVRVGQVLKQLRGSGTAILLVEHDMPLVMGICDYIYVLDHGVPLASGTPIEVRQNPKVIASYLGHADASASTSMSEAAGDAALETLS